MLKHDANGLAEELVLLLALAKYAAGGSALLQRGDIVQNLIVEYRTARAHPKVRHDALHLFV
ncbi:hypothetical protein SDC9_144318 [bioreactor metagenome]|uniref:Uncharacterized protein n=1 Tax=bioreactor metagenome TaxID=1076179 RepID=A0A645E6M2_9ZZZZ